MAGERADHGVVPGLFRKGRVGEERGLPKQSVEEITVDEAGVMGDFNRYRHEDLGDDPDSALLIVPAETIAELQKEGWPVRPGDLGENVSSVGIPYARFGSEAIVSVGTVRAVVTRPCDPCTNLYLLPYVGATRGPEFLRTTLHRRGWYARVVNSGHVRLGYPIELD